VEKVSSRLSKWFFNTPWTTKGCQIRYFLLAPIKDNATKASFLLAVGQF